MPAFTASRSLSWCASPSHRWPLRRAGPAGESLGLPVVFLIAGLAPLLIGVVAIVAARMRRDEIAHPLESSAERTDIAPSAGARSFATDAGEPFHSSVDELVASAA